MGGLPLWVGGRALSVPFALRDRHNETASACRTHWARIGASGGCILLRLASFPGAGWNLLVKTGALLRVAVPCFCFGRRSALAKDRPRPLLRFGCSCRRQRLSCAASYKPAVSSAGRAGLYLPSLALWPGGAKKQGVGRQCWPENFPSCRCPNFRRGTAPAWKFGRLRLTRLAASSAGRARLVSPS